jgi:hypothetical protein
VNFHCRPPKQRLTVNATYCSDKVRPTDGARISALWLAQLSAAAAASWEDCCVRSTLSQSFPDTWTHCSINFLSFLFFFHLPFFFSSYLSQVHQREATNRAASNRPIEPSRCERWVRFLTVFWVSLTLFSSFSSVPKVHQRSTPYRAAHDRPIEPGG